MDEKSQLIARLDELARQASSPESNTRSGNVIAIDQIAVFGQLLVVLGQDLNKAQKRIEYLTWAIAVLTAAIAVLTAVLVLDVFDSDDSDTAPTNITGRATAPIRSQNNSASTPIRWRNTALSSQASARSNQECVNVKLPFCVTRKPRLAD